MATITEKVKGGKLVSCKFRVCLGRDESKKQILRCMTWTPPDGLTLAKSRKAAKLAADVWEDEIRREYVAERESVVERNTAGIEASQYTFDGFVDDVWLPLRVCDGSLRDSSIAFYKNTLRVIMPHFKGASAILDKKSAGDIINGSAGKCFRLPVMRIDPLSIAVS